MTHYWGYKKVFPCWLEIWCDKLHEGGLGFREKRQIYEGLIKLETQIHGTFGIAGWISWTDLENVHIMKFFYKFGAQPFKMTKTRMYFRKLINEG